MIPISDNFVKRLVLEDLFMRKSIEDIDFLLDSGVPPNILDALRNLNTRDFNHFAQMGDVQVSIAVNCGSILTAVKRLQAMKRNKELEEYFVVHGANTTMLSSLFHLSLSDARGLRAILCPEGGGVGRPSLPTVKDREAIQCMWYQMKSELDHRERYFALHKQFPRYSLKSLWLVVTETDDSSFVRQGQKKKIGANKS